MKPVHDELHADRRGRRWLLSDLICDHVTGRLRESAVWSNIGKLAILYAYFGNVAAGNFETMSGVVAVTLLGHDIGNRLINLKAQAAQKDAK